MPAATGAKAAAAAPPESGMVVPILTVPVILSLTPDGQSEVSTLKALAPELPPAVVDDPLPPAVVVLPVPTSVFLSLLQAPATSVAAVTATRARAHAERLMTMFPLGWWCWMRRRSPSVVVLGRR